ncbi:hypothetical protein K7432_010022 [Basidiobolus ranarum]|uniref:NmrA-like domain-containing protein n=1 Tax=Basidiobolus ranarum TaxID=34480 RepID=A0ABR2VW59_9FUNG
MSGIKVIAVAGGSGSFGSQIVQELLKRGTFQVKILSRREQKTQHENVEVVVVDYAKPESLVEALKGVDVVISTLHDYAVPGPQLALVEASKQAGVKRFVPSEFAMDSERREGPLWESSKAFISALKQSGLPYTIYQNGLFLEYVTFPSFGLDIASRKAKFYGEGNTPMHVTSSRDVARFVAFTVDNPKSENRTYHIAADKATMNQIISLAEEVTKTLFSVTRVSKSDLTHLEDMTSNEFIHEHASIGVEDGQFQFPVLDNSEYPDFKFSTIREFLVENYSPADKN